MADGPSPYDQILKEALAGLSGLPEESLRTHTRLRDVAPSLDSDGLMIVVDDAIRRSGIDTLWLKPDVLRDSVDLDMTIGQLGARLAYLAGDEDFDPLRRKRRGPRRPPRG
jgi:hypothetical protein